MPIDALYRSPNDVKLCGMVSLQSFILHNEFGAPQTYNIKKDHIFNMTLEFIVELIRKVI